MIIPLSPFIHKLHWIFITIVAITFVLSTAYNVLSFPFSTEDPLKVFFAQKVDIDTGNNTVYLQGVRKYLHRDVVDEIPSAADVICSDTGGIRPGLHSCRWEGPEPQVVGSTPLSQLFNYTASRVENTTDVLRFTVEGLDTRACRIYFDEPVYDVRVKGASNDGATQPGMEISRDGVKVVKLWSRTWDAKWTVDVNTARQVSDGFPMLTMRVADKIKGRVACEYSEMSDGKIPALEEVITFVPKWVAVTKADDGLVEAYSNFSI